MAEDKKEETKEEAETPAPATKKKKKLSGKMLVLFIILPLILIIGSGAGLYLGGFIGKKEEAKEAEHAEEPSLEHAVFYEMPEMLINLQGSGKKPNYLKLKVSLALDSAEDQHHIESVLPLIVDQYQVYLRGLRIDDLQGSEGLQRLREELLMRAGLVAKPVKVRDVLFNQMLVQ